MNTFTAMNGKTPVDITGPGTATTKPAIVVPPLLAVKSSALAAIGYDAGALFVRMAEGRVCHFPAVSRDEHAQLMSAESIGKHFQTHIAKKHKGLPVTEGGA